VGEVSARSCVECVGDNWISPSEDVDVCFVGDGKCGVDVFTGEVNGLAVFIVADLVAGIVKLIRLLRGVCPSLGDRSSPNLVGLHCLGLLVPSPGLGIDSFDNLSTSVNFASPLDDCVLGEAIVGGEKDGTDCVRMCNGDDMACTRCP